MTDAAVGPVTKAEGPRGGTAAATATAAGGDVGVVIGAPRIELGAPPPKLSNPAKGSAGSKAVWGGRAARGGGPAM